MKTLKFDKIVDFGKIVKLIENMVIVRIDVMSSSLGGRHFDGIKQLSKGEYNDFSDLKNGEECAIFQYLDFLGLSTIHGITNKNKYDNAIRESQQLPKGWKHEPYYTVEETHGFIRSIEHSNDDYIVIKILIDVEHSITISTKDYELYSLNFDLGENVVIIKKTIFLPNGEQKEEKQVWNKKTYLAYIESNNERKKKEEDQNRRNL